MSAKQLTPEQVAAREARVAKTAWLTEIIRPLPDPRYTIDVGFNDLERQLDSYASDFGLNLDPDFQRGHVWTDLQRIAYIEGFFRGTVGNSQRVIQFNAPHWENDNHGGDLANEIQIVDGLQRLTAIQKFMSGQLCAFGMKVDDFEGSSFNPRRQSYGLKFAIHAFTHRRDLLRYYLDINSGGTPHSKDEIDRVSALLAECK